MKEVGRFCLNLPRGRGDKSISAGLNLNLLRQICNFISQFLTQANAVIPFSPRYWLAVKCPHTHRACLSSILAPDLVLDIF